MTQNQGDPKELWDEALEEDSTPAFELNTVEQFVEFIKVGVSALLEHKKLDKIDDITSKHSELIADIGLFLSLYGSYNKWKSERKTLKNDLAQTINQLKKLSIEHKSTIEMKAEIEKRSKELEHKQTEIEIRKGELEKNNQKLQSEIEKLNHRISEHKKTIFELSQDECEGTETVSVDQLNELRNAKMTYEIVLQEQKAEIDVLNLEIDAIDKQRTKMDEILGSYRDYLLNVEEFEKFYNSVKDEYDSLDKKRLYLETQKIKEEEKIEEIDSEIESKRSGERKIKDEVRKFDLEIEKVGVEKAELQAKYDSNILEIDKHKAKIDEIFEEKGDMDQVVAKLQTKAKDLGTGLTQIQNLLRLKVAEATQLQAKIDDNLTNKNQISTLSETLQDVRSQIEQIKTQEAEKQEEKNDVDERLSELQRNHNTYETKISEFRRKIENASSSMLTVQDDIRKLESRVNEIELEKKTVIAENQEMLDEIENLGKRKVQIEEKIQDIEKQIEEAAFAVSEKNKELIDVKAQRNEFIDRKFEFENRIIGVERLIPKMADSNDDLAPMPFGAEWDLGSSEDSQEFQSKNQFENYKLLANLRLELSNIIPRKLELEFRKHEIEDALLKIDLEHAKIQEEKEFYEEESEQKNNSFDAEISVIKEKIKELTDEITVNNLNKIEMMEKKEKLIASFKYKPGEEVSQDDPEILLKKSEITELEKDIFDIGEQIERIETFKSEMQDKLDDKIYEKSSYNSKTDLMTKNLEKLESKKETLEAELRETKPQLSEISKKYNQTKSKINEISDEYYSLTTEYARLIHQIRNQNDEIMAVDAEITKFEKELRNLNDEKDELRKVKEVAIEEEDALTEELRNMKLRVEISEDDITEAKAKLEETEAQVEKFDAQLREVLQKLYDTERFIEQNKERKTKIKESQESIENRINSIEALMLTKQNLLKIMRQDNENVLEKIDTLKSEKSFLDVQLDISSHQKKELEGLNEQLLDKIKQMKEKYDKLYDEYMNRDTVAKDLKVKYPIIEKELEKSRNTEKEAVTKLMRIEEQYSRHSDKTKALELMKTALTKDINQLKHDLENSRLEKSTIEAENEEITAQFQQLNQTIENLEQKINSYREMEKKYEAMKKRNEYLEAEMKKFSSLMGFEEIDITSELKQQLISNATLNLSARFLQRGWDYKNTLPHPDDIKTMADVSDALNLLSKPLDAMKLRVNLRKFFEAIKSEIPEKLDTYRTYFEKRNDEKPLSNTELKDVYSIATYYDTIKVVLGELMKNLKISVP